MLSRSSALLALSLVSSCGQGCSRRDALPEGAAGSDAAPEDASRPSYADANAKADANANGNADGNADADADADANAAAAPMRREDWEVAIGKWTFEPTGEASCECKATSSLLWWKAARPKDFDASFEVLFLTDESSAGLLFRSRGEDFYEDAAFYQFEWYTRGTHHDKRLSLMKKNPFWVQLVTPKFPEAPLNEWLRLRVRAVGDHLQTWVGDDLVFDIHDATFVRTGKIGLHVFQPRKVKLRDFRLELLDPPAPTK